MRRSALKLWAPGLQRYGGEGAFPRTWCENDAIHVPKTEKLLRGDFSDGWPVEEGVVAPFPTKDS